MGNPMEKPCTQPFRPSSWSPFQYFYVMNFVNIDVSSLYIMTIFQSWNLQLPLKFVTLVYISFIPPLKYF